MFLQKHLVSIIILRATAHVQHLAGFVSSYHLRTNNVQISEYVVSSPFIVTLASTRMVEHLVEYNWVSSATYSAIKTVLGHLMLVFNKEHVHSRVHFHMRKTNKNKQILDRHFR